MAATKFYSLLQFKEQLEFQASLLDGTVTEDLLSRLDPAAVFRDAIQGEHASSDDIRLFLRDLKNAKVGGRPLVTHDGLATLATAMWQVCWKVREIMLANCFLVCLFPRMNPASSLACCVGAGMRVGCAQYERATGARCVQQHLGYIGYFSYYAIVCC